MRVTLAEIAVGLRALGSVYRMPDEKPEAIAKTWLRVLDDLEASAFDAGVEAYLRSAARYWPRPGEIRQLALREGREQGVTVLRTPEGAYWAWEREKGDGAPCPVCESVVACLACGDPHCRQNHGRWGVLHDHQRHLEAGIPYTGPRTGPVNHKGQMLALPQATQVPA